MDNVIFDAEEKKLMLSNGYYSPFSRRILDDYEKLRMCSIDLFQLILMSKVNCCKNKNEADKYLEFIKNIYSNNRKYLRGKDYIGKAIANSYSLLNEIANKIYSFNYEECEISDTITIDDIKLFDDENMVSFIVNYGKISKSEFLFCPLHVEVTIHFKNVYKYNAVKEEYYEDFSDEELRTLLHKKGYIQYKLWLDKTISQESFENYCKKWSTEHNESIYDKILSDIDNSQDKLIKLLSVILTHLDSDNSFTGKCTNCDFESSTENNCDPFFIYPDFKITDEVYSSLKKEFGLFISDNCKMFKFNNEKHNDLFDIVTSTKQKRYIKDAFEKQLNCIEILSNNGSIYTNDNKGILKH